jgi:alkaline phosphatase
VPQRDDEPEIAPQYLDRVDVILGGGRQFFDPHARKDRDDLVGRFTQAGYAVITTRDALLASKGPRLLGTFASGHLPFTIDRRADARLAAEVPTLAEMAQAALARLLATGDPFLLQVEGARIDHAAHANDIGGLLWDQLEFDDALAAMLAATAANGDLLLIATSDHGNSNPGLNGVGANYKRTNEHFARIAKQSRSHEMLLDGLTDQHDNPQAVAAAVENALGFRPEPDEVEALAATLASRPVVEWNHLLASPPGILGQIAGNRTGIGWTSTSHTADPTLISAAGPGAGLFHGAVRNDAIHAKLLDLLG